LSFSSLLPFSLRLCFMNMFVNRAALRGKMLPQMFG
jgi:hypothetical protein